MLTILKYLKVRYIDAHLDEKAQGMVEYALLIAFLIGVATYLIYGERHEEERVREIFDDASETLNASDRNSESK